MVAEAQSLVLIGQSDRAVVKFSTVCDPHCVDLHVVKEVAMLRKEATFSHYIFYVPMPWNFLTKSEKYCFLAE